MKKVVSNAVTINGQTILRIDGIQHQVNTEDAIRIHDQLGEALEDQKELIIAKLDELADVAAHWKKRRLQGRTPASIREALLMLSGEIHQAAKEKEKPRQG